MLWLQRYTRKNRGLGLCFWMFTPGTERQSQTAAAVPWTPSWGRWCAAAALQSQRPLQGEHAECAWDRPDRWWRSARYLLGNAPTLDHHSASLSLWGRERGRCSPLHLLLYHPVIIYPQHRPKFNLQHKLQSYSQLSYSGKHIFLMSSIIQAFCNQIKKFSHKPGLQNGLGAQAAFQIG